MRVPRVGVKQTTWGPQLSEESCGPQVVCLTSEAQASRSQQGGHKAHFGSSLQVGPRGLGVPRALAAPWHPRLRASSGQRQLCKPWFMMHLPTFCSSTECSARDERRCLVTCRKGQPSASHRPAGSRGRIQGPQRDTAWAEGHCAGRTPRIGLPGFIRPPCNGLPGFIGTTLPRTPCLGWMGPSCSCSPNMWTLSRKSLSRWGVFLQSKHVLVSAGLKSMVKELLDAEP